MAICEKCIKQSVCKLCDGTEIMGCIEFVSKGKCVRASKGQEPNCSEIPTGSTAKIDVSDNNVGNMDCILRSDAIKAIQKYGVGCLDPDDFSPEQCERFVVNKLNELPSVTLEESTTKNDLGVDCISRKAVFEAIDDCNSDGLKGIFCSYDDGERFKEYIKNLPSVNTTRGDAINREAVLKLQYRIDDSATLSTRDVVNVEDIQALPSVTLEEPKIGHWVTRPHVYGVTYCSECGFELKIDNTNYCPNCGADMREAKE